MSTFWGKFDKIENMFENLTESVEECLYNTLKLIKVYMNNNKNETVEKLAFKVHKAESTADEYRRKIISELLEGSLMPNTREDLMNLIEKIDDIADDAERVMDSILFISLDISQLNKEQIKKMISQIKKQYKILKKAVSYLFKDMTQTIAQTGQLENIESMIDDTEEKIIRKISKRSNLNLVQKLAYRDTIMAVSDLGDTIEDAGDIIEIIVSTRRG